MSIKQTDDDGDEDKMRRMIVIFDEEMEHAMIQEDPSLDFFGDMNGRQDTISSHTIDEGHRIDIA
jgi:hypothetical protein